MGAIFHRLVGIDVNIFLEIIVLALTGYAMAVVLTLLWFARIHKFKVAGPLFVPPLIGKIVAMVIDPYGFWDQQLKYNPNGYSWTSIMNQFTVFATKADLCQKIFAANGPDSLTLVLHPNGRIILGENNIAFQSGLRHKALRASFINLFTTKALSLYLPKQQEILLRHLDMWATKFPKGTTPTEMRTYIREMNCETSQTVFIGPHLDNPKQFTIDYDTMTHGFLAPPIYFPGTALYRAVEARKRALVRLERAVASSKKAMSQPNVEPTCLLDFWTIHVMEEINNAKENGTEVPHYSGDFEMAETLMDFLFASQDASTASLTMITATMKEHPDILERVVKEQDRLRPNDEPLTFDLLQEMTFTRQCVLEQLRQYPPAPMVPMIAHAPFQIDDNLTVPKGTLVIPSLVGACRDGFTNPESFDPDRMGEERQEDRKNPKSNLVFGVGPHRCVGYNYAINHLTVYLALLAKNMKWERTLTPKSHQIMYLPTLYPWDCLCTFEYREGRTKAV